MSVKFINIGGVGSCELSEALRKLNTPCYPYDWNLTYQSAVIDSFINLTPLFIFDKMYYTSPPLFKNKAIRNDKNTAFDIHYFKHDFETDKIAIEAMYNRRLFRLKETLRSNDKKLLIRMMHLGNSEHREINKHKEKDILEKWIEFYNQVTAKYNNVKLLLISKESDGVFSENPESGVYLRNDKDLFSNKNKLISFLANLDYDEI